MPADFQYDVFLRPNQVGQAVLRANLDAARLREDARVLPRAIARFHLHLVASGIEDRVIGCPQLPDSVAS